jgi:hypothetical protein
MAQPPEIGWSVHRDAGQVCKTVESISPIVGNNTTEGTGVGVDLKGYEGAKIIMQVGTSLDTLSTDVYITPSVQDCATSDGTYAALDSTQYRFGANDFTAITTSDLDGVTIEVILLAGTSKVERWVRPLLTFTGTHTNGCPIAASVEKTHPRVAPLT